MSLSYKNIEIEKKTFSHPKRQQKDVLESIVLPDDQVDAWLEAFFII
jgi:hypothetical protein